MNYKLGQAGLTLPRVKIQKFGLYLLASLIVVLSLNSCASGTDDAKASLGKEFSLSLGQSVMITGEGLGIKFVEIMEDSRCAEGLSCVWEGRVTALVEISTDGSAQRLELTEPGLTSSPAREMFEGYEITYTVEPYPEAGKEISADEYRLLITVQDIEIGLAPIHEVQIYFAESDPPQVMVYIQGGLSNGCTTFHDLTVQRDNNIVEISVNTKHPKDVPCTDVYNYFEKYENLGTDFTSGETYTIKVNDYTTTFVMQ
ncbi:hypothetical protein ACFLVL_02865 [Chloroflexota bacterium]